MRKTVADLKLLRARAVPNGGRLRRMREAALRTRKWRQSTSPGRSSGTVQAVEAS